MPKKPKDKEEIIDQDFTDFLFSNEDLAQSKTSIRGSMRLGLGKAYSHTEWETRRQKVLKSKMH